MTERAREMERKSGRVLRVIRGSHAASSCSPRVSASLPPLISYIFRKDMNVLLKLKEQEKKEELSSSDGEEKSGNVEPKTKKRRRVDEDDDDCVIVHVDKEIDDKLKAMYHLRQMADLARLRKRYCGLNPKITDYFSKL